MPVKRNPFAVVDSAEGVYPAAEDTLLLLSEVDAAADQDILDVGTGTGFLAIHCALAGGRVVATDLDLRAVRCARRNAEASKVDIRFAACNLASAIRGGFDLVLFNPPYLPGDSGIRSVDGGKGGIEPAAALLRDLARLLREGGRMLMVLSSLSNTKRLAKVFGEFSFTPVRRRRYFFEELVVYEVRMTKK